MKLSSNFALSAYLFGLGGGWTMRKRSKPAVAPPEDDKAQQAGALVRGLSILRAFTPADSSLGNQELIERTGLPKATISRLTYILVSLNYLLYDDQLGRYRIGPATISLGYTGLSTSAVITMARPLMQTLADETGLAVAMGVRDGNQMIYTANCRSEHPVTLRLNVGSRLPIWRTAMGLAYLAGMVPTLRDAVVAGQIADEPHREADIRRLVATSLAAYERDGFVGSCGDWHSFINAVGVPFRPTDGSQLVAVTVGGIKDIAPPESITGYLGPKLKVLVTDLQNRLTGRDQAAPAAP